MKVSCIECGLRSDSTSIMVDIDNGDIYCSDCDATYTVSDIEKHIAEWSEVLPWIKSLPGYVPTSETPS